MSSSSTSSLLSSSPSSENSMPVQSAASHSLFAMHTFMPPLEIEHQELENPNKDDFDEDVSGNTLDAFKP